MKKIMKEGKMSSEIGNETELAEQRERKKWTTTCETLDAGE
jgi:hypothetical protein